MMGCAGSKSTPVVEANTDVIKNGLNSNGNALMQKVEEIVDDAKEMVTEAVDEVMDALKPSTPETQRASDSEESGAEGTEADPAPEEASAEDAAETEMVIQDVVDDPVEEPSDGGEEASPPDGDVLDESATSGLSDKPPTPMPEAVILNAQWPNISHESKEKSADEDTTSSPLDPIEEEERRLIAPNLDEAAVIEILTIEIAEIPIVDEATLNFENRENEKEDEEEESNKENNEDDDEGENKEESNEDDQGGK